MPSSLGKGLKTNHGMQRRVAAAANLHEGHRKEEHRVKLKPRTHFNHIDSEICFAVVAHRPLTLTPSGVGVYLLVHPFNPCPPPRGRISRSCNCENETARLAAYAMSYMSSGFVTDPITGWGEWMNSREFTWK
jgi:hypothetical protein